MLLVDGYNMCGYWPKLKKHFARGNLEAARDKLIDELITFTHIKGNSRNNTFVALTFMQIEVKNASFNSLISSSNSSAIDVSMISFS